MKYSAGVIPVWALNQAALENISERCRYALLQAGCVITNESLTWELDFIPEYQDRDMDEVVEEHFLICAIAP